MNKMNIKSILTHSKDFNKVRKAKKTIRKRLNKKLKKQIYTEIQKIKQNKINSELKKLKFNKLVNKNNITESDVANIKN